MELSWVFVYIVPVLAVLAVALLGTTRRIGFWGGLLTSILLTPIGGFLVALISGPKRIQPRRDHVPKNPVS